MVKTSDIVAFASDFVGTEIQCADDQDLLTIMHMGDSEAQSFMSSYADHFAVDAQEMLWFFHYKSSRSVFQRAERPVDAKGERMSLIPITPQLLAQAANHGTWPLEYPEHQVHVGQWPLILMFVVIAIFVLSLTVMVANGVM